MAEINIRRDLFSLTRAMEDLAKTKGKETSIVLNIALILYGILLLLSGLIFAFYLFHR